jgi:hypothetical protein
VDEIIANWASMASGGSDVELQPGSYRLEADDIKVVTGPLDSDFHLYRPEVTVARITRTEGTGLRMIDYAGDGRLIEEVWDIAPTETLSPLDAAGFTVAEGGLYRVAWGGKGTVTLVKVG